MKQIINDMKKGTWWFSMFLALILASCSFAKISDAPMRADNDSLYSPFIGKWLSLYSGKDSVQTHLEFKLEGQGTELVTKGDSVVSTYPFRYSCNDERITFEGTFVTLTGAYPYRFDKDTLFIGKFKYLKW